MADRIGQRFGDYHLLRFLGDGTFGDVYLGEHVSKKTPAAVKVFKTKLTPDKLKDFITEVRTVLLRHPNIVPVLDFGIRPTTSPISSWTMPPMGHSANDIHGNTVPTSHHRHLHQANRSRLAVRP